MRLWNCDSFGPWDFVIGLNYHSHHWIPVTNTSFYDFQSIVHCPSNRSFSTLVAVNTVQHHWNCTHDVLREWERYSKTRSCRFVGSLCIGAPACAQHYFPLRQKSTFSPSCIFPRRLSPWHQTMGGFLTWMLPAHPSLAEIDRDSIWRLETKCVSKWQRSGG